MGPADRLGSSSEAFKFPKLNGENYGEWKTHMKAALQTKYLWIIVSGAHKAPPQPSENQPTKAEELILWKEESKAYLEWLQNDEAAQGLMRGASELSQWPHVANAKTLKEVWDSWEKVHDTNQHVVNVHYYFEDLFTRKYVDGTSMADHVAAMTDLSQHIKASGENLSDLIIACALLLSLPKTPSWDVIKAQIFQLDASSFTSENVDTKLQTEANRRAREKASGETALLATKQK